MDFKISINGAVQTLSTPCAIDLSDEDYNSPDCPGIRSGMIKTYLRSPWEFYVKYIKKDEPDEEEDKSLSFGRMVHLMILEPDKFNERYSYIPEFSEHPDMQLRANTNKYKSIMEAYVAASYPKHPLTMKMKEKLERLSDGVRSNPSIKRYLESSANEKVFFWMDEESGLICRCKPDCINTDKDGRVWMADLKTTWSIHKFWKQVYEYGYDVQQAHYSEGYEMATGKAVDEFRFFVAETEWPYHPVYPHGIPSNNMVRPAMFRRLALNGIAYRLKNDDWVSDFAHPERQEVWQKEVSEAEVQAIYRDYCGIERI